MNSSVDRWKKGGTVRNGLPVEEQAVERIETDDPASIFAGFRVVEVAQNIFAPAAAMVLADFGADVIKVEHPVRGDPHRGLVTGRQPPIVDGVNLTMAQANRGKRSIGLDLVTPEGKAILYKIVEKSDVFLTNFLPRTLEKLDIGEEVIRGVRPDIIYAVASAQGRAGPESNKGGYDSSVYWAKGSVGSTIGSGLASRPGQSPPGFGDRAGAMNLAFGITAGLLRRALTGKGCTVDVSLLGTALWQNSSSIVYSLGSNRDISAEPRTPTNPLTYTYATADQRWLTLMMIESDRYWADFCMRITRPDLLSDPRFANHQARGDHAQECADILQKVFAEHTLAEWHERFGDLKGPWAPFRSPLEAGLDAQASANGYVVEVPQASGKGVRLVRPPVTFDRQQVTLARAPEHAEHGESILLEYGYDWPEIVRLKGSGVIT